MNAPQVLEHVDDSYASERVFAELAPLLHAVYARVLRADTSLPALHSTLNTLLTFLASPVAAPTRTAWQRIISSCSTSGR